MVAGIVIAVSLATHASDWQEIKNEAKGQTSGLTPGAAIPQLTAISTGLRRDENPLRYKPEDCSSGGCRDAVKRIQTEAAAGRKTGGSGICSG